MLRRGGAAVLCLALLLSSFAHASGFQGSDAGFHAAAVGHGSEIGCMSGTGQETDGACPTDVGCPLLALIPPLIMPPPLIAPTIANVDASGFSDHGTPPRPRPPKLSV